MKIDIAKTEFQPQVASKLVELIRKDDDALGTYAMSLSAIDADGVIRLARFLDKPGKYVAMNDPTGYLDVLIVRDGPAFSKLVREATRSPSFQDDNLVAQMEAELTTVAIEDAVVQRSMRDSDMPYQTLVHYFSRMVPERLERWADKASIDLSVLEPGARAYLEHKLAKSLAEYMI